MAVIYDEYNGDKTVYQIVIDNHFGDPDYYICEDEAAANKLFEQVVRDYFFDPAEDTEEDLQEAVRNWYWLSDMDDVITCRPFKFLTTKDIVSKHAEQAQMALMDS